MEPIAFTKTKLPFGWMGNMSPYRIIYEGIEYLTSEALFQCLRFDDAGIKALIRREKSPMGAKMVAKTNKDKMVVKPLSDEDVANMRMVIDLKLEQHPELIHELVKTHGVMIYEDVTARGVGGSNLFWGALLSPQGIWYGENVLGTIWMEKREQFVHQNNLLGANSFVHPVMSKNEKIFTFTTTEFKEELYDFIHTASNHGWVHKFPDGSVDYVNSTKLNEYFEKRHGA